MSKLGCVQTRQAILATMNRVSLTNSKTGSWFNAFYRLQDLTRGNPRERVEHICVWYCMLNRFRCSRGLEVASSNLATSTLVSAQS